jgi:spore germination cell wall hydrolase CwlJ-like protein
MFKFPKAAPVAALLLTLLSAASFTDAGLAYGAKADTALEADTIKIDPEILAETESARNGSANSVTRTDPLSQNKPDIAFTPGTGGFVAPLPKPETDNSDAQAQDLVQPEKLTASNLAALVAKHGAPGSMDAETRCLAGAVYFESKGESLPGQLAVARVVLARTKSGRFAPTICGVVFQKSQFSFVRGGRMPAIDTGGAHWRNAVAISKIALNNSWKSPVEGALFFHARYVSPGWKLKRLGAIDNHIFYR